MKISRAVAGLLLLALFLGTTQAGNKCANCGLGEGVDACNCGNSVVRSHKLEKPEFFASPEAIKNALKLKSASIYAPGYATVYSPPIATYAAPVVNYGAPLSGYNAVPAPSPVSYATPPPPPTPSPPIRSKSYVETKCRNGTGSYGNGEKHRKDNEDLASLLSLRPGISVAPKFEPIGDLCRCKGKYGDGDDIVGVVPARPGKLPLFKRLKPKPKPPPTYPSEAQIPAYPPPVYSAPTPSYSAPALSYIPPGPSYFPPAPSYSVPSPSYSAPVPSYSAPVPAPYYSAPASSYSASAATAQYAPAYQTPAVYSAPAPPPPTPASTPYAPNSAQNAPAYPQQSPQMIYVISPPAAKITYRNPNAEPDCDKNKRETITAPYFSPDSAQYASASPQQSPQMIYIVDGAASASARETYNELRPKADCDKGYKEEARITSAPYISNSVQHASTYSQQPPQMVYAVGDAATPSGQLDYRKDYKQEASIVPAPYTPDAAQYTSAYPQPSGQMTYDLGSASAPSTNQNYKKPEAYPDSNKDYRQGATVTSDSYTPAAPAEYIVPTYQQSAAPVAPPAPGSYGAEAAPPVEKPSKKSKKQINYEKGEEEAEMFVEIELQREQAPKYTADPVSVSLAYKILADSQGKKHVPEDSLAYGHYKEPEDGRVNKRVSDFDEEKLHTVDKPVVELKCGKCGNSDGQNLQISYGDIGFGPVAPSKNRFVPKTDDSSNSPYRQTIIYVPPPEDKDSLPCGPLGPTIPGYKSGGVIHGESGAKSTCACGGKTAPVKEGSRRAVLVDDQDEYEGGSDKSGIVGRIKSSSCNCKSSSCKCKQSEYR